MSSLNTVNTEREPCLFKRRDFVSTPFPLASAFAQKKKVNDYGIRAEWKIVTRIRN